MNKTTLLPLLAAFFFLTLPAHAQPLEGYTCQDTPLIIDGCGPTYLCTSGTLEERKPTYYQTQHFKFYCKADASKDCQLGLRTVCSLDESIPTFEWDDYETIDGDDITLEEYHSARGCSSTTTTPLPLLAIALGFFLLVYVRTNKD